MVRPITRFIELVTRTILFGIYQFIINKESLKFKSFQVNRSCSDVFKIEKD